MARLPVLLRACGLLLLPTTIARQGNGSSGVSVLPSTGRFRVELRLNKDVAASGVGSNSGLWVEAVALSEALQAVGEPVSGYLEATVSIKSMCQWIHGHLPLRAPPPDSCMDDDCQCEDDAMLLDLAASVGAAARKPESQAQSCGHVAAGLGGGCRGDLGKYCPRSCGQCVKGTILPMRRKKQPLASDFCKDKQRPPWAWFTHDGQPLDVLGALPPAPATLVVLEVGTWIHPPVAVGHTLASPFRTVSMSPPIFTSTAALISNSEADEIISLALSRLSESVVEDYRAGKASGHSSRTSATARLVPKDSPAVARVFDVGRQLLNARWNQFEQLQVVRYLPGEYYHQHHDFFEYWKYPQGSDLQRSMLKRTRQGTANRVATLLWYLGSTPTAGTNFPLADSSGKVNISWEECGQHGLTLTPERGHALLFYSVQPNGTLDSRAMHAGCTPDSNSTKWVANLWLWNVDVSEYEEELFKTTSGGSASSSLVETSPLPWTDRVEV